MSKIPANLRYTQDHEWVVCKGDLALIGITDHAQDQLGDIVYVGEFPEIGDEVDRGDVIGVIESVKATSDIFSPVSGTVVEINPELADSPELVNSDPYGDAWMIKIRLEDKSQYDELLDADAYENLLDQ